MHHRVAAGGLSAVTSLESRVRAALSRVTDERSGQDIVAAGYVEAVVCRDGTVHCALKVDPSRARELEPLRARVETAIRALEGVEKAQVILTAARASAETTRGEPRRKRPQDLDMENLVDVRHIIAIASGKGGVGKSTVTVNIAAALAGLGRKVGILDADIYGPSQPRMLGLSGQPESPDGKTIIPLTGHGLKVMSIGFMVAEDTPTIWRGPMVQSALQQMLGRVLWGALDYLLIDMPPGTGDAQLSIGQQVPLAGAVIVTTPQTIALLDARKGLNMFSKLKVPILGIVENMAGYICPRCGHEDWVFAQNGGREQARKSKVPLLGSVPLDRSIMACGENGKPVTLEAPDGGHGQAFRGIARELEKALASLSQAP